MGKKKQKTERQFRGPKGITGKASYDRVQSIIDGIDRLATEMEQKWGVGRLPLLVGDVLREKFKRQLEKFNDAVWNEDLPTIEAHGEGLKKGWQALDSMASEAGAEPLNAEWWEVELSDGSVAAIVRNGWDGSAVHQMNRAYRVYTLSEIARLIEGYPTIAKAKETFPGASVTRVRPSGLPPLVEEVGDEIPFGAG